MTTLSKRAFGGEIPRVPADKLPDTKAQQAVNCDFAYGELRPSKGGFLLKNLSSSAKSLFSIDGLQFASWNYKTKAWKGPVTNDTFRRFYFTSANGGLRVSQTDLLDTNGGEPSASYSVGVPSVTEPLTYVLQPRVELPDYPNAAVKLYSYYEDNGKRYNEQELPFTIVKPFKEFTFLVGEAGASVGDPTTVSSEARTLRITSVTYVEKVTGTQGTDNFYEYDEYKTVTFTGGAAATIVDASTITVGGTTYSRVSSITPEGSAPLNPGAVLNARLDQSGVITPAGATPSIRVDVIDTAKNATIFTVSASSSVTASRSDGVPGGVEAVLMKDGEAAGAWRLTLKYGVIETRAYVVTMVNNWNEESKPSAPLVVQPTYMDEVNITFTAPSFSGYVGCNRFRVYRTVNNEYLSCTPTPQTFSGSLGSFIDTQLVVKYTDSVLESDGWDLPPSGLKGLTLMPNGFFAAFSGDTLYFSEPFRPWAWPYATSFPVSLVGMRALENSLIVTTTTTPYVVSGVHPSAMTQSALSSSQAGVSDHGMCVVGNAVAYISNDGLAIIRGYDVDLSLSQQLWTREVWRQKFSTLLPNMELAYHDGALVCSNPSGAALWELRLDSEGGGNLTMLSAYTGVTALYVLPSTDQLYMVTGSQLIQYKGGQNVTYDWWGKEHILTRPINFGAGYINTDGPVTVTLYADGLQWHQQAFTAPGYFRIPSGSKKLRWSIRVQGTGVIKEISIAETMEELKNV